MAPVGPTRRSTRLTRSQGMVDENTSLARVSLSPVTGTGTGTGESGVGGSSIDTAASGSTVRKPGLRHTKTRSNPRASHMGDNASASSQPVLSTWSPSRGNVSGASRSTTTTTTTGAAGATAAVSKDTGSGRRKLQTGKRKAPSSPAQRADNHTGQVTMQTRASPASPDRKRARSSTRAGQKPVPSTTASTTTTATTTTAATGPVATDSSSNAKVGRGDEYFNAKLVPGGKGDKNTVELFPASWYDTKVPAALDQSLPVASEPPKSHGIPTRHIVCESGAQATVIRKHWNGAITSTPLNLYYPDGDVMVQDVCTNLEYVFFSLCLVPRDGTEPYHIYASFDYEQVTSGEQIWVAPDLDQCTESTFQIHELLSDWDKSLDSEQTQGIPRYPSRSVNDASSRTFADPRALACTKTRLVCLLAVGAVVVIDLQNRCLRLSFSGMNFKQIVAGDDHFVALSSHGDVFAWGSNSQGQLAGAMDGGDNFDVHHGLQTWHPRVATPALCMNTVGMTVVQVAASGDATIVTTIEGEVYRYGQFSQESGVTLEPRDVAGGVRIASCRPLSPQSQEPNLSWLAMSIPPVTLVTEDGLTLPGLRLPAVGDVSFFDVHVDTSTGIYDVMCPLRGAVQPGTATPAREMLHFRFRGPFQGNLFHLGKDTIVVTQASPQLAQVLAAAPSNSPCRQPWTSAAEPQGLSQKGYSPPWKQLSRSPAYLALAFDPRWAHIPSYEPSDSSDLLDPQLVVVLHRGLPSSILLRIRSMGHSVLALARVYGTYASASVPAPLSPYCTAHHAKHMVSTMGYFAVDVDTDDLIRTGCEHVNPSLFLELITLMSYPVLEIWETYVYPFHIRHSQRLPDPQAIFGAITSKAYQAFCHLHITTLENIVRHLVSLIALIVVWRDSSTQDFCNMELFSRVLPPLCQLLQTLYEWFCLGDTRLCASTFRLNQCRTLDLDYEQLYDKYRVKDSYMNLAEYHFLFDAEQKQKIWRHHLERLMKQRLSFEMFAQMFTLGRSAPYCDIHVKRETAFEDSLSQLTESMDLRLPLRIFFHGEEGVDEGGVQKDFFQIVFRHLFNGDDGRAMEYFPLNSDGTPWFDLRLCSDPDKYYDVGILFGLAVYNKAVFPGVIPLGIIDALLADVMDEGYTPPAGVGHWLGLMKTVYPSVAASLQRLWVYPGEDWLEHFGLSWNITTPHGSTRALASVVKKHDGANYIHAACSKEDYIIAYCHARLVRDARAERDNLRQGFITVVGQAHTSLMPPSDLQLIMCGQPLVDIRGLREHTRYRGGYSTYSEVIRNFWKVIERFTSQDVAKFLAFCTGCARVPLGGWSTLQFTIQRSGDNEDRLPCAHTCFNTIDLPQYRSAAQLETKLRQAMDMCTEFALV